MAKIIKRNDEYFVQFYGNGLLFEKYAGTDKEQAEKFLTDIEASLPDGAMSNYVPDQSLVSFSSEMLDVFYRKYSRVSAEEFKKAFDSLEGYLKERTQEVKALSGVTPKVVESYQDFLKNKFSDDEADYQLFLLKGVFDFAITKTYLNDNPTLHVKALRSFSMFALEEEVLRNKLKDANSSEELIVKFLLGDTAVSERLKLVKWKRINDQELKDALVTKLLKAQVSLMKIFEIFDIQDIREIKPYAGWSALRLA